MGPAPGGLLPPGALELVALVHAVLCLFSLRKSGQIGRQLSVTRYRDCIVTESGLPGLAIAIALACADFYWRSGKESGAAGAITLRRILYLSQS